MKDDYNYIKDMKEGNFPGDDGLNLYQNIIKDEFEEECKEKYHTLEKEMAIKGFHFTDEKNSLEEDMINFTWKGKMYKSFILPIEGKDTYCIVINRKEIIPIKDEETMDRFLELIFKS